MTPLVFVLVALAGGIGAAARFLLDGAVSARRPPPVATVAINLSGSLALGLVVGLAAAHLLPPPVRLVAGTGFLGGYTTLSTASIELARLVAGRRGGTALLVGVGVPVLAVVLAGTGLLLGAAA